MPKYSKYARNWSCAQHDKKIGFKTVYSITEETEQENRKAVMSAAKDPSVKFRYFHDNTGRGKRSNRLKTEAFIQEIKEEKHHGLPVNPRAIVYSLAKNAEEYAIVF